MASNLECVGLAVDETSFGPLVEAAIVGSDLVGEAGGLAVRRWTDPSGARLVLGIRGNELVDLLPSYAGVPGARLGGIRAVNDDVAIANVLDADGAQATMLAAELEQFRLLPDEPFDAEATVVALGVDMTVHTSPEAFAASDASIMGPPDADHGDPPPHVVENGWPWPPRMAAESFISFGVFGEPADAQAYAQLNGLVLAAERRTVQLTGQDFVVARVRTAGFEADLCLPGPQVPAVGSVVAGTVFLVAALAPAALA